MHPLPACATAHARDKAKINTAIMVTLPSVALYLVIRFLHWYYHGFTALAVFMDVILLVAFAFVWALYHAEGRHHGLRSDWQSGSPQAARDPGSDPSKDM